MPEAAAEVQVFERDAVAAQFARQSRDEPRRARAAARARDLRADVHVDGDQLQDGRPPSVANSSRASSTGTPNLLIFSPVEMCGWLFASMSGLTRTATRAGRPSRAAIASTRASSPGRLDVDGLQAERRRRIPARRATCRRR